MKISMSVTYNDTTTVDAVAVTTDLVAFEDHFDRSVARLETELRLTDVCWLAWTSLHRAGSTTLDFPAWLDTVDRAVLVDSEEPVPLDPTASTSE
jgi:hypothetical protein